MAKNNFLTLILFFLITFLSLSNSVTYDYYPDYCNKNPYDYAIPILSSSDQSKISKLLHVSIFIRHGARTTITSLKSLFPNLYQNLSFECNISTVETRAYNNDFEFISFKKVYVPNEQIIEGNCQQGQLETDGISQHKINGIIVNSTYIGNKPYHLTDNIDNIINTVNNNNNHLFKVYSTDYERTLASAAIFLSSLLNNDNSSYIININTHDLGSDPLAPNNDIVCSNISDYTEVYGYKSNLWTKYVNTDSIQNFLKEWKNVTGSNNAPDGLEVLSLYCNNYPIPVSYNLFNLSINYSYTSTQAIYHNQENSYDTMKLIGSPMLNLIRNNIVNISSSNNNNYNKFILYAFHDTSILILLEALNVSDGIQPVFAEMLSLEIYNGTTANQYYFRWIRRGKTLQFPGCPNIETDSELCDLNILLDMMSYSMPIKEWEPYCYNATMYNADNSNKKEKDDWKVDSASVIIGISVGLFMSFIFGCVYYFIKHKTSNKNQNFGYSSMEF